jgi:hypothetical protein
MTLPIRIPFIRFVKVINNKNFLELSFDTTWIIFSFRQLLSVMLYRPLGREDGSVIYCSYGAYKDRLRPLFNTTGTVQKTTRPATPLSLHVFVAA